MPTWSVGSRERCQPSTEMTGKPVTESNLSLRMPAQRAAVMGVSTVSGRPVAKPQNETIWAHLSRRTLQFLVQGSSREVVDAAVLPADPATSCMNTPRPPPPEVTGFGHLYGSARAVGRPGA
jgi:hypothetical protein